ncbi:MAG: transcription elongation factor GreA [Syntrophales bacterium]|jgi:transcription elongation factor GreA|nr:transcription elongation factor GreA [Syntrophales bacterium]MCK9528543.1 transcription elongation factor GreA [Syntrophales bacterium]MDX9922830.1 transcription elongation factor GreA [Syntrophales bacterium]
MQKVPITKPGFEKLKKDLDHLKRVAVPENIRAIEAARSYGDISENAEYEAAKTEQSFIQGKIQEIENKLAGSHIIEVKDLTNERIVFGSTVTLEDMMRKETIEFVLVGPYESDVNNGKISVTSPIGKALIGKEVGQEVSVRTPGGLRRFEVVDIAIRPHR